jgi:hypothetical protein
MHFHGDISFQRVIFD